MHGHLDTVKKIVVEEFKNDVKKLDESDIDDPREQTPLVVAARHGQYKIVEYLLQLGVKTDTTSISGATPLHLAAQEGFPEICTLLIKYKADVNDILQVSQITPLIAAAESEGHGFGGSRENRAACMEILLQNNADTSIKTINELESPLYKAAEIGFMEAVQLLIKYKSDLDSPNKYGWTPISIARQNGHLDVVNVLLQAGAIDSGPPKFPIHPTFFKEKLVNEGQDVDEMKIQTMYKMVEECTVITQGREVLKKVLYLTNKQAILFDEDAMQRAVQALDIGDPKFVIKLLPALGLESQMRLAHPEEEFLPDVQYGKSNTNTSEICKGDERLVETQILQFMKSCILPLAMQTRALILVSGANDCYMSAALASVFVQEQARLGKDCPFTVIATASEAEVHAKAVSQDPKDQGCIASQIARQSASWQKRIVFMNDFYSETKLCIPEPLEQCDLTEAAQRYIIFEGYEEGYEDGVGSMNRGPQDLFESIFLQHMTRKLPSIAIQCLSTISNGIPFLVDLTSRNIPCLLLDTSERCFTSSKLDYKNGPMSKLAKLSDAFPSVPSKIYNEIKLEDGSLSNEGKQILIELAFEMVVRKMGVLADHSTCDSMNTSLLAFFHSVLSINESSVSETGVIPLYARIKELERIERTSKDSKKALISPEAASKVMEFIFSKVKALDIECQLHRVENWLDKPKHINAKYLIPEAAARKIELQKLMKEIDSNGGYLTSYTLNPQEWLAYYDLLTSSNTFSGSIFDIDEIKRILGSVAKIDRLPNANSLEALRTLQDAWDHVEVYNLVASSYKTIAKITYVVMLIVGILITAFSMIQALYTCGDSSGNTSSAYAVIILSFIGTTVASYVTYTNPAVKWQQLRTAALSIESNIWTFRTRAGPYRTTGEGFDQSAEKMLSEVLKDIKEKVLEGADIKNTSFYARVKSQNKHGQHAPYSNNFGPVDNFAAKSSMQDETSSSRNHSQQNIWTSITGKLSIFGIKSKKASKLRKEHSIAAINAVLPTHVDDKYLDLSDGARPNKATNRRDDTTEEMYGLIDIISRLKRDDNELDNNNVDSHYEPLQPDAYIKFRVYPVLTFYKNRIPRSNNIRNITQFLLVLGSIGAAILGIINLAQWASGIAILTASITAYLEFSGTNSKMSRYSFTVHALQDLIYWWQTLPTIDRSVVANIDRLVLTCEELLNKEQQAWRSTSQTIRMLQKQSTQVSNSS